MLNKGDITNFRNMVKAAKADRLALLECAEVGTGKPVATIVFVNRERSGDFEFVPVARMFDGNPFEQLIPPDPNADTIATPTADGSVQP